MKKYIIVIAMLSTYIGKVIAADKNIVAQGAKDILNIVEKTSSFSAKLTYKQPKDYCQESGLFTTTLRSNNGKYCENEFFAQFAYIACYQNNTEKSEAWGFAPPSNPFAKNPDGSKCWQIITGTGIAAKMKPILKDTSGGMVLAGFIENLKKLAHADKDRLCQALAKLNDNEIFKLTIFKANDGVCK